MPARLLLSKHAAALRTAMIRFVVASVISLIVGESVIEWLLWSDRASRAHPALLGLLDAGLLVVLWGPVVWWLAVRPLARSLARGGRLLESVIEAAGDGILTFR